MCQYGDMLTEIEDLSNHGGKFVKKIMKNTTYIILIISFINLGGFIYGQDYDNVLYEYKSINLKEEYQKEIRESAFKISSEDFIKLRSIKGQQNYEVNYLILFFLSKKNEYIEQELPAKISDFESYESPSFLLFENVRLENKIFMWKIEGEYFSRIFIFRINATVDFLGEITIGKFCEPYCDAFNLNNSDISVKGDESVIEIIFKGKTFYSTSEIIQSNRGGRIIADNLTLSYFH